MVIGRPGALHAALACAALAVAMSGCVYSEDFSYGIPGGRAGRRSTGYDGHIVSGYGTANLDGRILTLQPGAVVTLRKQTLTAFETEFFWRLVRGEGMRLRLSSTDRLRSVDAGIALTCTAHGSTIDVPGSPPRIVAAGDLLAGQKVFVRVDGDYLRISLGCDEVFAEKVALIRTDALVFETVGESEAKVMNLVGWELD